MAIEGHGPNQSLPDIPFYRFEGVPVVTFYVGPDKVVFHVHEHLLFDASPVFKAAFSGHFKEASERSMPLPEDDKDSVERMVQWLYTKEFDLTVPVSEGTSAECYLQLAKLNTLAEKYDIYLLRNHIVDKLFDLRNPSKVQTMKFLSPPIPAIKHVYDNTTERSSFRKLIVAWHAYHIGFEWYDKETTRDVLAKLSPDFAIDLAMELGARQKHPDRRSPFTLPKETFYEEPPKVADEDHAQQELSAPAK